LKKTKKKETMEKRVRPTVICKNCEHPLEAHLNLDPANKVCNYNAKHGSGLRVVGGRCGCVKPFKKTVKHE